MQTTHNAQPRFNTHYQDTHDIEEICVPQLKAVGAICFNYAYTMGAVGTSDRDTAVFDLLDELICDIANGLEKYANQD